MKEIGGYFGLEPLISNEYYPDLIALNNARNALLYLLKSTNIKKLYIPYFLCDSVSGICDREGYSYEYYNIGQDFLPIFDQHLDNGEYIYVVNYYGQLNNSMVQMLQKRHGNIIFDNVQAFFQRPVKGIDTLYSCRKFFGVPDGAYLATDALLDEPLTQDVSKDRMKHVLGRYEHDCASDYYADFKTNDDSFVGLELRSMSKLTHNILGAIDYQRVIAKRNQNWIALHDALGKINKLSLTMPNGPYMYPFYHENGMEIKKKLAQKRIFVPTLWPNVLDFNDCELEKDYAQNILPLPVDQRYDAEDMKRIIQKIFECEHEGR